jgi:hypothetical protein
MKSTITILSIIFIVVVLVGGAFVVAKSTGQIQQQLCQEHNPQCFSCCDLAGRPLMQIAINYDNGIPLQLRNLIKQIANASGL